VPDPSPDQLVSEIETIRLRLAGNIDELIDRSSPKSIAQRQLAKIKARFIAPDGSVRMDNVVSTAGIAVAVLGGVVVIRKLLN